MDPRLQQLVNEMDGKGPWYVTGPDSGQCTAVPHEWQERLGLPIVYGDAKDTFTNAPDDLYEKELNGPVNFPRPGSIMVWGAEWGGGYGHTALVLSANPDTFTCLEQNNPGGSWVHQGTHNYSGVIGWFYPRMLNNVAPAPEAAPEPTPVPIPVVIEPTPTPVVEPVPTPEPTVEPPAPIVVPEGDKPVIKEIKTKFVSRKFLLALAGVVAALANNDINGAVLIVLGFMGIQGAIDHKNAGL